MQPKFYSEQDVASLLLVQRSGSTARALGRFLKNYYVNVSMAETPEVAEELLKAAQEVPTHVICGQIFGPGSPRGQDLLKSWRHRFPQIRLAVLATGIDCVASTMEGVDGVYEKPAALSILLNLLGHSDKSNCQNDPLIN